MYYRIIILQLLVFTFTVAKCNLEVTNLKAKVVDEKLHAAKANSVAVELQAEKRVQGCSK